MNVIELHILQSFPTTCLNRDDVGSPKSAEFGGVQRARVSSQCWKRAQRDLIKTINGDLFAANRTRYLIRDLEKAFNTYIKKNEITTKYNIHDLASAAADNMGKIDNAEKGNIRTLLFYSPQELIGVVEAMLNIDFGEGKELKAAYNFELDKKQKDKAKKSINKLVKKEVGKWGGNVKDAADIAIFGRMVANDRDLTVEGAAMYSHALSTHKVNNEIDFFSAVDDLNQEGDEGAGHIGILGFNSACYYRYIALNVDMLRDTNHIKHFTEKEFNEVLNVFVRTALLAVPSARKNSMMGFNPPEYVLGTLREGQPVSLINAFENPVRTKGCGYIKPSIDKLEEKFEWMKKTYSFIPTIECRLIDNSIDNFIKELVDNA